MKIFTGRKAQWQIIGWIHTHKRDKQTHDKDIHNNNKTQKETKENHQNKRRRKSEARTHTMDRNMDANWWVYRPIPMAIGQVGKNQSIRVAVVSIIRCDLNNAGNIKVKLCGATDNDTRKGALRLCTPVKQTKQRKAKTRVQLCQNITKTTCGK